MEPDQIAVQDTQQDLSPDGYYSVDLAAWEWCMQEEADLDVGFGLTNLFSQHCRQ